LENPQAARSCKRVALGVIETKASETNDDDDQAAAQDGQTSDDDSEEASGNAIKVTHDTPLGSKGNGADQLIKTFGIPRSLRSDRIGTEAAILYLTRFRHANRYPLRWKTL
jgi:hypothetical protein